MSRIFTAFLAFCFSAAVYAAQCTQYQATDDMSSTVGDWSASPESAVSSLFSKLQRTWYGAGGCTGSIVYAPGSFSGGSFTYTATYSGCSGGPAPQNGTGRIATRTVDCDAASCASRAGKETTINWTVGYTRSPDTNSDPNWQLVGPPNVVPSDGVMCDPTTSCKVAASFAGNTAYQSKSPTSQGLYRLSLDMPAQHLGDSCTPTAAEIAGASPKAPQPTCPGAVGEVNGVLGCYGTASNPTRNDLPASKPVPPVAGNPSAGEKPSNGEGSGTGGPGRTPTNGDGGPAGGPAGAAGGTGTKPDGTTDKPGEGKEQANCGAPGQPKCQIDESGTPNGSDSKDKLLDAVNKAADDKKAAIENASKLKADGWTFTFALPSGCSALTLTGYQIPGQGPLSLDVCKWQPVIHDIMSMVWLICTVWGCINMVGAAQRGS